MTRVGLIGLGYWGPNYARILNELSEATLESACDIDPTALELVRDRFPTVALTTDPAGVLENPSVEAVVIATPTVLHAELTLAALSAGKHVLCEKPLAMSASECDELIEASKAARRVLMVGHTFIFNPAVRRMRELIAEGELGTVLYCHASRTGLGPIRADVNALWDLAPHDISIVLDLLESEPVQVAAHGEAYLRPDTEDVVFVTLRFEGSALANLHVSWLDPYKVRKVTVIGDRRMVVFDDVATDEKLKLFDKGASYDSPAAQARGVEYGEYKAIVRDGDIVSPKLRATEPLKEEVSHFLECCRSGSKPETDADSGKRVVAVLEAASESLRQGGAVIDLAWLESSRA